MTDEVISIADRRNKDADRYRDVDCAILDIVRLTDLAMKIWHDEVEHKDNISDFGPTLELILKDLQRRTNELASRLWHTGGDDPAA